ncbi:MAG TPA: glycosyltransferase family 39 protein [Pseudomonadales bacterium]|nr:glycosyltransferase family 39 protein [Pseudomonadales bacterium]
MSPALKRGLFYAPLLVPGACVFSVFLFVTISRIAYPYELEWMEGGVLQQVLQLVHGGPLYGDASMSFAPALYMPFYYVVSALSVKVFGEGFFALRFVSLLASLFTHLLVYLIVNKVTASRLAGWLGVFFYAMMFRYTAFWFDVARVDCLWTALLAAATYVLLCYRDKPADGTLLLLAMLGVMAFFTKQATLFLFPFVAITLFCWCGWHILLRFCLLGFLLLLPGLLLMQWKAGHDWYFYTMQMASTHGITWFGVRRFFEIFLAAVPVLLLGSILFLCLLQEDRKGRPGWVSLFAGFIFLSLLSRAYAGAFFNVLMPAFFFVAVTAACGFARLVDKAEHSRRMTGVAIVLAGLLVVDVYRSQYSVLLQLPSENSRSNTAWLLQKIAAVPGPVCVTSHGYLGWMAGKDFCAHNTQVTDLVTGSSPARAQHLQADARQKILAGYYQVLVLDREKDLWDLGLHLEDIPYTATPLQYPQGEITFVVNGRSPRIWLQYNGAARIDPLTDKHTGNTP